MLVFFFNFFFRRYANIILPFSIINLSFPIIKPFTSYEIKPLKFSLRVDNLSKNFLYIFDLAYVALCGLTCVDKASSKFMQKCRYTMLILLSF